MDKLMGLGIFSAICLVLAACHSAYASGIAAQGGISVNSVIDVGQSAAATATVSGGPGGGYFGQWTWIGPGNGANQTLNDHASNVIGIPGPSITGFNPEGTIAYTATAGFGIYAVNATTNTIIGTISVGYPNPGSYVSFAINPSGTLAYETCCQYSSTNSVEVIDLNAGAVVNAMRFGTKPGGVAFNPQGSTAYVSNGVSALYAINVTSNSIANAISLTGNADTGAIAVSPSGSYAYVAVAGNAIDVVSTATNAVTGTIHVGEPDDIAFNPSGSLAYAVNYSNSAVYVINTASSTVVNTIADPISCPIGVSFNPSGTLAYVGTFCGSSVSVINVAANTVMPGVSVGGNVHDAVFSPSGMPSYADVYTADNMAVIIPPESRIQSLPQAQPSNGLLQLTINAVSANTILFTFNGITYTESAGSGTIYGNWTLYGFAQGYGTAPYGGNSLMLSSSIMVNPPVTASSITASNATVAEQEDDTLTGSWAGGTPPYTASFSVYNSVNGNVLASGTFSGIGATTRAFTFMVPYGSNSLGSPEVRLTVTDSASYPQASALTSNPISSVKASREPMSLGICNAYGFEGRYYLSSTERCSLTGAVQSPSNQLVGSLYINNALVANTVQYSTNSTSYAVNLQPGTYLVSFNSVGSSEYVQEGINATLVIVNSSVGMGINGGPYWWGYTTSEYGALGAYNVTYLRMDLLEPPNAAYQSEISNLTGHGFKVIGILDYNTLCGPHGNDTCPSWGLGAWNAAVSNALAAYPTVHVWEIWNEPQYSYSQSGYLANGIPSNYSRMVESASALIRAHNSSDTVLCFGGDNLYSGGDTYDAQFYLWASQVWSNLTAAGATSDCNAISLHAYTSYYGWLLNQTPTGGSYTMTQVLGQGLSAYENLTGKPIWITEYGMPADNSCRTVPCNLSSQATFDAQGAALFLGKPYIRNVDVYNIEDSGYGLFNYSVGVNNTRPFGTPGNAMAAARPAFYSYTNFSDAVKGVGPATHISIAGANSTVQSTTIPTTQPTTSIAPTTSASTPSSQPTTTAGGSGGAGGTGGGGGSGGGGGNFKPTLQLSRNGTSSSYYIYNFTQDNLVRLTLNGTTFNITENFINPGSAGITINGRAYAIYPDQAIGLGAISGYRYSIRLYNVSYLPILHTITLGLSSAPTGAGPYAYSINGPSGSVIVDLGAGRQGVVNYDDSAAIVNVTSHRNATATVSIANASGGRYPAPPQNYTILTALNVSINGTSTTAEVTLEYTCGVPPGLVQPFVLLSGTWRPVGRFTVSGSRCDATFGIPADPIVALMEHSQAQSTSSAPTSVPTTLMTTVQGPALQQRPYAYAVAAAVIIAAASASYWVLSRRLSRGRA